MRREKDESSNYPNSPENIDGLNAMITGQPHTGLKPLPAKAGRILGD
jgi:hypothetical protein